MYMTASQRRDAKQRQAARIDALMLGALVCLATTAIAFSFVYSPFLAMFWRVLGAGA